MAIKFFPVSNGSSFSGKLISEYNLINLVNRLTDRDSFIVSYDNSVIKFSIHGYYFECDISDIGDNKWAYIYLTPQNTTATPVADEWSTLYLEGSETNTDEGSLTGLRLSSDTPVEDNIHVLFSLQLFDESSGDLFEDNLIKFTTDSTTRSITIDDGDLDA